jgi:penicillin V acylase-like amidase (Ntn superfamily)
VANAEAVRPTSRVPIHYLFADASGDAAAIEFLDGKLVVHRGATLPVKALANSPYTDSVAAFEAARRTGEMPTSGSSLDRFVRGAMLASGEGDPMARSFAVLAAVARPGFTRWSIVYDLGAGDVYFKTDTNEAIRRVTVTGFDWSCRTPVQILDVTAQGSGDVATTFVDYTRAANRALLEASYAKTPFLQGRSETEKDTAAAHADATSSCAVTD